MEEENHYTEPEPQVDISNAKKVSKLATKKASFHSLSDRINALKAIVRRNETLLGYVRKATASGNNAVYKSILEKVKKAHEKKPRDLKRAATKRKTESQANDSEAILWRRETLKLWNPEYRFRPEEKISQESFNVRVKIYQSFYELLQDILDSSPDPNWQKTTFPENIFTKPSRLNRQPAKEVVLGAGSEEDVFTVDEGSTNASIKQEPQDGSVGFSKQNSSTEPSAVATTRSRSDSLVLRQRGTSTQDAIMID